MIKRVGLRYTIVFTRKSLSERVRLDRLRECYTRYAATVSAPAACSRGAASRLLTSVCRGSANS